MGFGFTIALTVIGLVREFLGASTVFGMALPQFCKPISIFVKAPGAFLVMAILVAVLNACNIKTAANKKVEGCDGCCTSCAKFCEDKTKEDTEA